MTDDAPVLDALGYGREEGTTHHGEVLGVPLSLTIAPAHAEAAGSDAPQVLRRVADRTYMAVHPQKRFERNLADGPCPTTLVLTMLGQAVARTRWAEERRLSHRDEPWPEAAVISGLQALIAETLEADEHRDDSAEPMPEDEDCLGVELPVGTHYVDLKHDGRLYRFALPAPGTTGSEPGWVLRDFLDQTPLGLALAERPVEERERRLDATLLTEAFEHFVRTRTTTRAARDLISPAVAIGALCDEHYREHYADGEDESFRDLLTSLGGSAPDAPANGEKSNQAFFDSEIKPGLEYALAKMREALAVLDGKPAGVDDGVDDTLDADVAAAAPTPGGALADALAEAKNALWEPLAKRMHDSGQTFDTTALVEYVLSQSPLAEYRDLVTPKPAEPVVSGTRKPGWEPIVVRHARRVIDAWETAPDLPVTMTPDDPTERIDLTPGRSHYLVQTNNVGTAATILACGDQDFAVGELEKWRANLNPGETIELLSRRVVWRPRVDVEADVRTEEQA